MVQEEQEPAAPGAAQQGAPSGGQQLLSGLLSGLNRQSAQLPGQQNHGQGAGSFGAASPAPPLPSGLPLESRLFTNPDAGEFALSIT